MWQPSLPLSLKLLQVTRIPLWAEIQKVQDLRGLVHLAQNPHGFLVKVTLPRLQGHPHLGFNCIAQLGGRGDFLNYFLNEFFTTKKKKHKHQISIQKSYKHLFEIVLYIWTLQKDAGTAYGLHENTGICNT